MYPEPPLARRVRRRRSIRAGVTLFVLLAILAVAAWYGWKAILGPREAATVVVCQSVTPTGANRPRLHTSQVTVNVYNAGTRSGLAAQTAKALSDRGFKIGTVANDPLNSHTTDVTIRTRSKTSPQAELLAAQVKGAKVATDTRTNNTVDLVVGNKFPGLVKKAPTSVPVTGAVEVCVTTTPSGGTTPSSPASSPAATATPAAAKKATTHKAPAKKAVPHQPAAKKAH